jgi:phosphoglycolate phosphatase-like HAD superfamily hydrolase
MSKIILMDIDGTLTETGYCGRPSLLLWRAACAVGLAERWLLSSKPREEAIHWLQQQVVRKWIISSREERFFTATRRWLFDQGVPCDRLLLRPKGLTPVEWKTRWFLHPDVVMLVDDDTELTAQILQRSKEIVKKLGAQRELPMVDSQPWLGPP